MHISGRCQASMAPGPERRVSLRLMRQERLGGMSKDREISPGRNQTGLAEKRSAASGDDRYRWYVLLVLTLAQICHTVDRALFGLLLEPLGRDFRLSDQQLGLLAGFAYGLSFAVMVIPIGMAVDRVNRTRLLAAVLAIWSAFTAMCGLVTSYAGLVVSRALVGAAEAGSAPTSMSLIADYFRREQLATATSIWYLSAGIGTTLTFLAGGYLVENHGWRVACLTAGAPGIAVALLLLAIVREPVRGGKEKVPAGGAPSLSSGLRYIHSRPALVQCMAGIVLLSIPQSGIAAWIASFLIRSHGLSMTQVGFAVAITSGLLGSIGGLLAGGLVDWLNRRIGHFDPAVPAFVSAFTVAAATLLFGIALTAHSAVWAIGAFILSGLLLNAHNGPASSLAATLAGPDVRGLTIAIIQFGANLIGWGLGPLIVGTISGHFDTENGVRWGLMSLLFFSALGSWQFCRAGVTARGFTVH